MLAALRVVLPGVTVLARLIARVRERTGRHVYRQVVARLNAAQQNALETLLVAVPGERLTPLEVSRTSPTRVSAPALVAALQRLDQMRALGVSDVPLSDPLEARLARMARHAQLAWTQPLLRMGTERLVVTLQMSNVGQMPPWLRWRCRPGCRRACTWCGPVAKHCASRWSKPCGLPQEPK